MADRRVRRGLIVLGGAAAVVAAAAAAASAAQSALPSPCDLLPGGAGAVCDAAGGVTGGVGGVVGGVGGAVAGSAIEGLASAFAAAGGFFLGKLADLMGATTEVDLGADWFVRRYAIMFGISAFLTFALLLLSVIKAAARGHALEAIKSGSVYYLAAVVASAFAPAVAFLVLQLSDAATEALTLGTTEDTQAFLHSTGEVLGALSLSGGAGPATVLVTALVTILCAVVLWIELLLRSAIIYVAVLFAAPTFSGLVDRAMWRHSKRWIFFVISVAFAKPVVVAVMTLAAAGAARGGSDDGFSTVFVAVALMTVAIFCVGLLFRLVPSVGDEIAGAVTARRDLKTSTPNSPLPGPGIVVRQSVQTHLVRGAARSGAARSAAAGPLAPAAAGAMAAHRVGAGAVRGAGTAVRSGTAAATPASGPTPRESRGTTR